VVFGPQRLTTAVAIPKAQQFVEKIHAYTYPWTDRSNTRTRDLIDLLLLLDRQPPDPQELRASIAATFATRRTHPAPAARPAKRQRRQERKRYRDAQAEKALRRWEQAQGRSEGASAGCGET